MSKEKKSQASKLKIGHRVVLRDSETSIHSGIIVSKYSGLNDLFLVKWEDFEQVLWYEEEHLKLLFNPNDLLKEIV